MMKNYNFVYALMACCVLSCTKSDENSEKKDDQIEQSEAADYNVLVNTNGKLSSILLNADAETLVLNMGNTDFGNVDKPLLVSENGKVLTMYHKKSNCTGMVSVHNFNDGTTQNFDLFADFGACTLTPHAIVNSGNTVYVAYEKEISDGVNEFAVRAIDITTSTTTFRDIGLEYLPVGLAFSNDRLFVLGFDEDISGEHKLIVIDDNSDTEVFQGNLGFNARVIFKNPKGDIIIGYDELHTTIDKETLVYSYTNYTSGFAPKFTTSKLRHFDSSGKMYYAMTSGSLSSFNSIPAIYDFEENSSVLYAYENFLTEAQLKFEFEIENTTMVHYDEVNNLLLVGYKKKGTVDKGGLLRINPDPNPEFAGNLDLDGVPYAIFIK